MAKITTGGSYGISRKQAMLCQMVADGVPRDEIIGIIWGEPATHKGSYARNKALRQYREWLNNPAVLACYHDIMRPALLGTVSRAYSRVDKSIDSTDNWLAYNAARDTLTKYGSLLTGEDNNTMTIKVEGMPTLGSPENIEDSE